MAISKETVEHVAHLARIELSATELEKLSRQLEAVLGFIDNLKKADTKGVSPTSHILPIKNVLREDAPKPSLAQDAALANAPLREGNFFVVPKVIE
jgi:aspartyl-tRNA(Asn)/glutamyl-tRNA(Gln) amidotransferase subunit C